MPEDIVNIINKISEAKGEAFAEGFVAGINLTTPAKKDEEKKPG
jgi:hypothetical protein